MHLKIRLSFKCDLTFNEQYAYVFSLNLLLWETLFNQLMNKLKLETVFHLIYFSLMIYLFDSTKLNAINFYVRMPYYYSDQILTLLHF